MDSSGSLQSSSSSDGIEEEEEYNSRGDSSLSAFFNNNSLSHAGHVIMSNPPPPAQQQPPPPPPQQPPEDHHNQTTINRSIFDPLLSNYLDPLSYSRVLTQTQPLPLMNIDMIWSNNIPSETKPSCTGATSSSPINITQQFLTNQTQIITHNNTITAPSSTNSGTRAGSSSNSRKRARASRRAPTTVLTTDTTNFRAMVQEFTGIPAPPFASSPFQRTRLDLFGNSSSLISTSNVISSSLTYHDPHNYNNNYLLRPFPHKIRPLITPPLSSATNNSIITSTSASTSSIPINYDLTKHAFSDANVPSLISPLVNFQSLQTPVLKFPDINLGTSQPPQAASLETTDLEGFGNLGHGLRSLVSSSTINTALRKRDHSRMSEGSNEDVLRSINVNYSDSQRILAPNTTGNSNYLNPNQISLDLHGGDNGQEEINVVNTRSEGMVESWINCSSDI